MKKILKLSLPFGEFTDLSNFIDLESEVFNSWDFAVNESVRKADAWFVLDDLPGNAEECEVPPNKIFLGNSEVAHRLDLYKREPHRKRFASQFESVYTFFIPYSHSVVPSLPFLPWMVHANHGPSIFSKSNMDIAFLKQDFPLQKLDKVSVFCSNKTFLVGHRKRLNFVKELKTRLGSRLDWYGNGINPIAKKYDGLAPYKYSIVLENQRNDYVLTEKLYDPFLTLTYPFYWGAGNSSDFFEQRGYGVIDIDDPDYSSTMILAAINEGLWDKSLPFIKENKARTLKELNFLRRMLIICENSKPMVGQNILIKPLKYYETSSVRIRKHVKRKVRAMVNSFNTITPYGEKL